MYPSWTKLENDEGGIPLQRASNAENARILLDAYPEGIDHFTGVDNLPIYQAACDYRVDVVRILLEASGPSSSFSKCRSSRGFIVGLGRQK